MALDIAKANESLDRWCERNGIDLGEKEPEVIGYWCRVSGVPAADEILRSDGDSRFAEKVRNGWREADDEMKEESI